MLAIIILIVCIGLANFIFLEKLFLEQKEKDYTKLAEQFSLDYDGDIQSSIGLIDTLEEKYGLNVVIADQMGTIQYTTIIKGNPWGGTAARWKNDNISLSHDVWDALTRGETSVYYTTNEKYESETINITAPLINKEVLILETMIHTAKESMAFYLKYYVFIGMAALLLGLALSYFISVETTMSVSKINIIANRMANSDFSIKYTDVHNDEIDEIGESLNILSNKLQETKKQAERYNMILQEDTEREKKIERKRQEFISNVSHELKTPVSVIRSYASGLLNNLSIEDPEAQYYCKVISEESEKMMELITELLEISKLDIEVSAFDPVNFDIISMIENVSKRFERDFAKNDITYEICKKHECITVKGDPYRIEQVIVNLFTNAIKYAEDEKYIIVKILKGEKKVIIKVYNTGKNIPDAELGKIWESFYKADRDTTKGKSGTGLGLYIVKKVLRMHKSRFGVRNLKGGVEFWFDINCF